MKLIPEWRRIAARAWSMWGLYAMAALTAAEVALPVFELQMSPDLYGALMGVILALTALARVLDQSLGEVSE